MTDSTSSVAETKERFITLIKPLAKHMNFTFSAFGESHLESGASTSKSAYHISILQRNGEGLEPAPITPSSDRSFGFMAGTSKAVFGDDVLVVPTGMYGMSPPSAPLLNRCSPREGEREASEGS